MKTLINITLTLLSLSQSVLSYCSSVLPLHQYWLALGFSVGNMLS